MDIRIIFPKISEDCVVKFLFFLNDRLKLVKNTRNLSNELNVSIIQIDR